MGPCFRRYLLANLPDIRVLFPQSRFTPALFIPLVGLSAAGTG